MTDEILQEEQTPHELNSLKLLRKTAFNAGKITSEEAEQITNILQLEALKLGASLPFVLKVFNQEHLTLSIERQDKLKTVLDRWQQCEWIDLTDSDDSLKIFCEEYFRCKSEVPEIISQHIEANKALYNLEKNSCVEVGESLKEYNDNLITIQEELNRGQEYRMRTNENFIRIQKNFYEMREEINILKDIVGSLQNENLALKARVSFLEGDDEV